jgi:hypothetical protein
VLQTTTTTTTTAATATTTTKTTKNISVNNNTYLHFEKVLEAQNA